jgi:hypothetical protein
MTLATKIPVKANNRPKTSQKSKVRFDYEEFSPNVVKSNEYARYINFKVA